VAWIVALALFLGALPVLRRPDGAAQTA